ncbi:MAG: 50S ribosomal protein L30 [Bacteroidetes bacterium]|nr:50S ribosomal protein L30 [Bacteroidota bacterium]MBU1720757.1 50S ribosomal protein L30 [Bacteroidota bacterium]
MEKAIVTQIKSAIKRPERQKRTLTALGLRKMNQSVEVVLTPQIQGMIHAVQHLVRVEKI